MIAVTTTVFLQPALAASLSGVVRDRDGVRVPNVDVSITCRESSSRSTLTDDSGYFEFHRLAENDRCKLEVFWGNKLVFRDYYGVSESRHVNVDL